MTTYTVRWAIELDASDPRDAANQALEMICDPESVAHYFDVLDETEEIEFGTFYAEKFS